MQISHSQASGKVNCCIFQTGFGLLSGAIESESRSKSCFLCFLMFFQDFDAKMMKRRQKDHNLGMNQDITSQLSKAYSFGNLASD